MTIVGNVIILLQTRELWEHKEQKNWKMGKGKRRMREGGRAQKVRAENNDSLHSVLIEFES